MTKQKSHREFWIRDQVANYGVHDGAKYIAFEDKEGVVYKENTLYHVVEISALEAANERIEHLESLFLEKQNQLHAAEENIKALEADRSYVKESTVSLYEERIHCLDTEKLILAQVIDELIPTLQRAQKIIRDDFHERVCLQSMGCHCKPNFIDDTLASVEGKLKQIKGE